MIDVLENFETDVFPGINFKSYPNVDKNVLKYKLKDGSLFTMNEGSTIKIDNALKDQRNVMLKRGRYKV